MSDENDTEASRKDALNAYEGLFGDTEPGADDAIAKKQDAKTGTGEEQQLGSEVAEERAGADESGPIKDRTADDKTSSSEDLKVVLSIKDGRATVGVQQPSSDPHVESVAYREISGIVQEDPAVVERASARWDEAPKYPAYMRPALPTRNRSRRERRSAQGPAVEGEGENTQQQALKLF